MPKTTENHSKTLPASQVETWLASLVRNGGVITGMSQFGAPGGKLKVTVTVTRG